MKKYVLSLLVMFLCIQAGAQEENLEIQKIFRYSLYQEIEKADLSVKDEIRGQGVIVFGRYEGKDQIGIMLDEKTMGEFQVLQANLGVVEKGEYINIYTCKSSNASDPLLYNVTEMFEGDNHEVPVTLLVTGIRADTNELVEVKQYTDIEPVN